MIGLGEYSVANDDSAGGLAGKSSATGGRDVETGVGGAGITGGTGPEIGNAGEGGTWDGSAGTAGEGGALESGGSSGTAGTASGGTSGSGAASGSGAVGGSSGSAGSGGAAPTCPDGCDDANDCTSDSCVMGTCMHSLLKVGAACGVSRSCDAQGLCVRCRDTAAGTAQDAGCSPAAPICLGTGLDAACAGCVSASDCNDGNDCTTETCSAGKCGFATVPAGDACATGVCNGTASAEKCVACADTAAGGAKDAGCTNPKPVCDPSGTPTCYECNVDTDCASDNVSCTVEKCTNHVCSHVATDSLCPASGDVCKPNKCDAAAGCKVVDISTMVTLIDADTVGNGSFELGAKPATGWTEAGKYWLTRDCVANTCTPGSNSAVMKASAGKVLAWLGGVQDAGVGELSQSLALPAGIQTLHIQADSSFQTQKNTAANADYFQVRLMDVANVQIGSPLLSKSAMDAVTGTTHPWVPNGIDVTRDVSAYAGKIVSLSFWSSCDSGAGSLTDFYVDNVRVTATICK